MKIIVFDGGGSSLKTFYYINNYILKTKKFGAANIINDYKKTKKNILNAIKFYQKLYPLNFSDVHFLFSLAGINSDIKLADKFKIYFQKKYSNKLVLVADIFFHHAKFFLNNDGIVINLGTGTSILERNKSLYNLSYGFGKNFLEPGNGYTTALHLFKFLSMVEFNKAESFLHKKFLKDFSVLSIHKMVKKINNYEVSEIAKYTKWLLSLDFDNNLQKEIILVVNNSFKEIYTYLEKNLHNKIYFVGSIVNSSLVQSKLKDFHNFLEFNPEPKYKIEEIWNMLID